MHFEERECKTSLIYNMNNDIQEYQHYFHINL